MKVTVRPASHQDIEKYAATHPPCRAYVYVGEIDGEFVGMGGFAAHPTGAAMFFLDAHEGAAKRVPVALAKAAKMLIQKAKDKGFREIVSQCDEHIDRADRFLEWLGFEREGDFFIYKGK